MKRILFDTNVILDVLLERQPHSEASASLWSSVESTLASGLIAAHAVTTIHYLLRSSVGKEKANKVIVELMKVFKVATVDTVVVHNALHLHFRDFEDAVTAAAAHASGCDWIATRDTRGFRGSPVTAASPEMLLPLLQNS